MVFPPRILSCIKLTQEYDFIHQPKILFPACLNESIIISALLPLKIRLRIIILLIFGELILSFIRTNIFSVVIAKKVHMKSIVFTLVHLLHSLSQPISIIPHHSNFLKHRKTGPIKNLSHLNDQLPKVKNSRKMSHSNLHLHSEAFFLLI